MRKVRRACACACAWCEVIRAYGRASACFGVGVGVGSDRGGAARVGRRTVNPGVHSLLDGFPTCSGVTIKFRKEFCDWN